MSKLTIALDIMGGDHGPPVILSATLKAIRQHPDFKFILCGQQSVIEPAVADLLPEQRARVTIEHCDDVVDMGDAPAFALRNKKQSSMRRIIELVESGEADACVSAGNTGALLAMAYYLLKTLPGIDRPALVSAMPTASHHKVFLLDLGANVNCTSEILFQYGVMASVLAQEVSGIEKPRVALLNVGEEDIKGNAQVKIADQLFRNASALNYIGYVEGDDIFTDYADVVVTDGFTGNVALKVMEGTAQMISGYTHRSFTNSHTAKIGYFFASRQFRKLRKRLDPRRYNGAIMLGLNGILVKSHGGADALAFANAIDIAADLVEHGVLERMERYLSVD